MILLCSCNYGNGNNETNNNDINKAEIEGRKVTYKDIIYDRVILKPSSDDFKFETRIQIYKKLDEYNRASEEFNFDDEVIDLYNEEYFNKNDLIVVTIYTTPGHNYILSDIVVNADNKLIIRFDDKCPKITSTVGIFKGILVDIDKDQLNDINETELNVNTVYTD